MLDLVGDERERQPRGEQVELVRREVGHADGPHLTCRHQPLEERIREGGCEAYLSKPISPETLMRKIGEWYDLAPEQLAAALAG